MTDTLNKLIRDLSHLAARRPGAPVSLRLSGGAPHADAHTEPYVLRGVLILPIADDDPAGPD